MIRFITSGSIILMLMLFSSLGAQSSSKSNKRVLSTDNVQTEQVDKTRSKQEEKQQPAQAARNQTNKTVSVKQEKASDNKTTPPAKEKPVQVEKTKTNQQERVQTQPVNNKTNYSENVQHEQSSSTYQENDKPVQPTPTRASQPNNAQFEQLRFLKTNQAEQEKQIQIIDKRTSQTYNERSLRNVPDITFRTSNAKTTRSINIDKPPSGNDRLTGMDAYTNNQPIYRQNPAVNPEPLTPMSSAIPMHEIKRRTPPSGNDNPPPNDNHHPQHPNSHNYGDNDHYGWDGNYNHHNGYGAPHNYGWNGHHSYNGGYGPYYNHGYGWYDYSYYWQSGLTIYFVINDDMEEFKGYLVDNDQVDFEYSVIDLRYRANPYYYSDIHKHNADCPEGGYGLMVKLQNGEYAYFHLDAYGNKKAKKLFDNPRYYNQKINVDVTGILNTDTHTIEVLTLKKAVKSRNYYFVGYFPLPRSYYRPYYYYSWWDVHPYRNRDYHRYHSAYFSYNW